MGNEECGNSTGRDREEKINEVQKMQCVGHQDKNHLGHCPEANVDHTPLMQPLAPAHREHSLQELLFSFNVQIL